MVQLQRYLVLDNTEIVNGRRVDAYLRAGLAPGWDAMDCLPDSHYLFAAVPDDGPYVNPFDDNAPWASAIGVDAGAAHFFGLAVRSFTADLGPIERVNGSSRRIGRLQTKVRRYTLEADLIADDCCGTDFGRRWLLNRFGVGCGNACTTQSALVAVCGSFEVGVSSARTSYRVGLVSFEDLSEEAGIECCYGMRARVVFDAEDPWWYGEVQTILPGSDFEVGEGSGDCVVYTACPAPEPAPCTGPVVSTIAPPPLPSVSGPLAPGGTNAPWCEPLMQSTLCTNVVIDSLSAYDTAALVFEISAGSSDLLNARVRIWDSDQVDCETLDPQTEGEVPFAELDITFVPAGGTLVVDGAAHTILLYCPDLNQWINADHVVYGPTGAFWRHPVIGCDIPAICVCFTVDSENTAADARVEVRAVPRFI